MASTRPRPRHAVPAPLAAGPFTTATALTSISRRQLQGRSYRRLMRGAHWVSGESVDHGQAIRAAVQVLPPTAVIAGRSALWCHGVEVAGAREPVDVIVPPGARARSRAEIRVRRYDLRADEWGLTPRGDRLTTPARTAFDLGRSGPPLRTVPMLDALIRTTEVPIAEIVAIRRARPGARGVRFLDLALDLVDAAAESFPESQLRVTLVQAGLPSPVANYSVFDGVRFVARVDLAWPHLLVAVEYDGAHHDDPTQIAADRRRLNALRALGWTVLVIDRHQLRRPDDVVGLVRRVLRQAGPARSGA